MKFIVGFPPNDPEFDPKKYGWTQLDSPNFTVSYLLATIGSLLFASLFLFIVDYLLVFLTGEGVFGSVYEYYIPLVFSMAIIPLLHELCRLPVIPFDAKDERVITMPHESVVWLEVAYNKTMSRSRFTMVLLSPFIILSIIPIVLSLIFQFNSPWIYTPAFINGIFSADDFGLLYRIIKNVAKESLIRTDGLEVWYKSKEKKEKEKREELEN